MFEPPGRVSSHFPPGFIDFPPASRYDCTVLTVREGADRELHSYSRRPDMPPEAERGSGWHRRSSRKLVSRPRHPERGAGATGTSSVPALYEEAVRRREALISADGPLVCRTGQHTGRSPNDKFIVREPSSEDKVWWGKVNRPIEPQHFDALHQRMLNYVEGKELFVQDCYAGADPRYRLPVRIITEQAWHSLFARHMFIDVPDVGRPAGAHAGVHRHRHAGSARGPGGTRHELRSLHPAELRQEAGPDRRHELRRGDQEVDLHRHELPAAAAQRDVDALLGQRRHRRRRGALLRPVGHRQDDAVERSASAA